MAAHIARRARARRWVCVAVAIVATVAASAILARPALAQLDRWQLLRPGGRLPQGLVGASSAYDPINNRMFVFAGTAWEEDHEEVHNSVWALDFADGGEKWTLLRPYGKAPYYRRRPASTYDSVNERMLIFGGFYEDQRGYYYDTWMLDFRARTGGEWIEHPRGAPHPDGRQAASLITQHSPGGPDPVHRAILFGGYSVTDRGSTVPYNDVWAFGFQDGQEGWTQIEPAGDAPKTRDGHSAIYDADNNRMIVFGGWNRERRVLTTLDDVWALDLTPGSERWTELQPDGRPLAVAWQSAVYDPCDGFERMLVFGGYNYTGNRSTSDVWSLSLDVPGSEKWERIDTTGARPTPRDSHVAQYDPVARRLIIYSGWDGPGKWKRDSWVLELLPCSAPTPTATTGLRIPTTQVPPPTETGGTPPTDVPTSTATMPSATPTDQEPTPTVPSATPADCADAFEPDEIWYQAKLISTGETQQRTFHVPGDKDFVKFVALGGHHYKVRTLGLAPPVNTTLTLYATDGVTVLASNDDDPSAAPASRIEWTCPADGTYFMMVTDAASAQGGCDMRYSLELTEGVAPTATPTPTEGVAAPDVYLPFAQKALRGPRPTVVPSTPLPSTSVCNPGFETGSIGTCWSHGGELPQRVVDRLDDGKAPAGGTYALLLGDPSLGAGSLSEDPVPIGSGWVEQVVDVPAAGTPTLSFAYRMITYDMAEEPRGTVWDVLAVSIDGQEVFDDGNRTSPDLGVRHEIGWRTQQVDLSPWRGQSVGLRFANWNGRNGAPGAEWYNTWTYIDNVVLTSE